MTAYRVFFVILFFASFLFIIQANASVGQVVLKLGTVELERSGVVMNLEIGDSIEEQDVITTKPVSKIQIAFIDETTVTLGGATRFSVQGYISENSSSDKADFGVTRGTFKIITGRVSQIAPDNFKVKTRTATIGIRGTIFTGKVTPDREYFATQIGRIIVTEDLTGRFVEVPAGQYTEVIPGRTPDVPKATTPEIHDLFRLEGDSDEDNLNQEVDQDFVDLELSEFGSDYQALSQNRLIVEGGTDLRTVYSSTNEEVYTDEKRENIPKITAKPSSPSEGFNHNQGEWVFDIDQLVWQWESYSQPEAPISPAEGFNFNQGEWVFNQDDFVWQWSAYSQPIEPSEPAEGFNFNQGEWVFNQDDFVWQWSAYSQPIEPSEPAEGFNFNQGEWVFNQDDFVWQWNAFTQPEAPIEPAEGSSFSQGEWVFNQDQFVWQWSLYPVASPPPGLNLTGMVVQNITPTGAGNHSVAKAESISYTFINGNLTASNSNQLSFYNSTNLSTSVGSQNWIKSYSGLGEPQTVYVGFEKLTGYELSFIDKDGNSEGPDQSIQLFRDEKREFFIIALDDANANSGGPESLSYREVIGLAATSLPSSGVATYTDPVPVNPVDRKQIKYNFSNKQFLGFKINDNYVDMVLGKENVASHYNLQGTGVSYDAGNKSISFSTDVNSHTLKGNIYGSVYQGIAFVTDTTPHPNPINLNSTIRPGYRTAYQASNVYPATVNIHGYVAKEQSPSPSTSDSDMVFDINTATGQITLDMGNKYMTGGPLDGAFITPKSFGAIRADAEWIVALEGDNTSFDSNEHITWGYWGDYDTGSTTATGGVPQYWVGGYNATQATAHLNALIGATTATSYTYVGSVLGRVTDTGVADTISDGVVNAVFQFGSSVANLNSLNISFTSHTVNRSFLMSTTPTVDSSGFFVPIQEDSGPLNGFVRGRFFGSDAEAIAGALKLSTTDIDVQAIFHGKR
ncbi:FecR domain-containing protein [Thiomicrospira microaerophila]|uniref:FecR family protein n=1 Tax=Thiomicrospira microaerophila TaxID=406020 RepID=UPI00200ED7C2|nr:FecR family protein [Thiomicrospira microaerophila]UQB42668.1 FecR domain-containing protein [Thiomicrospira microaerophila]